MRAANCKPAVKDINGGVKTYRLFVIILLCTFSVFGPLYQVYLLSLY